MSKKGQNPGYDWLSSTGTITVSATTSSKFNIDITSLTSGNVSGNAENFDNSNDYSWTIATAAAWSWGAGAFSSDLFSLNYSNFTNPLGGGYFGIDLSGTDLVLTFNAMAKVWNGLDGDGLFNTGLNWVGGEAPGNGVGITFGADGTTNKNAQNDIAGFNPDSITFRLGGFTLSGLDMTVNNGIVNNVGTNDVGLNLTLGNNQQFVAAAGTTLNIGEITNTIDMNGKNLTAYPDGTMTITSAIGGTGSLTKSGTGTLTLSGANSYVGSTAVNAGTLMYGNADALPAGSNVAVAGGVLNLGTYNDTLGAVTLSSGTITGSGSITGTAFAAEEGVFDIVLTGAGGLTKSGDGTVNLLKTNTYSGTTTVSAGSLVYGAQSALGTGDLIVGGASAGTLNMGTYNDTVGAVTLSNGTIAGTGTLTSTGYTVQTGTIDVNLAGVELATLTKSGTGTVTLNGTNSYMGATTVSGGTLTAGRDEAISPYSQVTVDSGAVLNLGAHTATVRTLAGSGTVLFQDGGAMTTGYFDEDMVFAGAFIGPAPTGAIDGPLWNIAKAGAGTATLSHSYTGDMFFIGNPAHQQEVLEVGGLTARTYSGLITVSEGMLTMGATNALRDTMGISVSPGAVLNMNGQSVISDHLVLTSGALMTGGGTLQTNGVLVNAGTINTVLAQSWMSAVTYLKKEGAGTAQLDAVNTYTGGTLVNQGTLQYGINDAISTGAITVNGSGVLNLNSHTDAVGQVVVSGGGKIIDTIGGGSLSSADFQLYEGEISASLGGGKLTKTGLGVFTLSGSNSYTGETLVNQGTLVVTGDISSTIGITVADGALLKGSGNIGDVTVELGSILAGTLQGNHLDGAGLVSPGNSPGILGPFADVDVAGGIDWKFEFTANDPLYNAPAASLNDVLHLTDPGTSAFINGPMDLDNVIDVYFNMPLIAAGDKFTGGFFVDGTVLDDPKASIDGALFNYYFGGQFIGSGADYFILTTIFKENVEFDSGIVSGYVMQLQAVGSHGGDVPEPSTLLLLVPLLGFGLRKLRKGGAR